MLDITKSGIFLKIEVIYEINTQTIIEHYFCAQF